MFHRSWPVKRCLSECACLDHMMPSESAAVCGAKDMEEEERPASHDYAGLRLQQQLVASLQDER
eukprot:4452628-Alexandrium_andersonii.AAC.1